MKSKKDLVPSIDMMGILENLGHVKYMIIAAKIPISG